MANDVSILKSTYPEVLCKDFEAIVVLPKVRNSFSIDWLHVECLYYRIHLVYSIFFQSAYSASFLNLTLVKSNCELIHNSLSMIWVKMTLSRLTFTKVAINAVATIKVFTDVTADILF